MLYDQGIEVNIIDESEKDGVFYSDMELLYVIQGEIQVRIAETDYILEKEDIILLNRGLKSNVKALDGAIACSIRYDDRLVSELLKDRNYRFICNSVADGGHSYEKMQKCFRELVCLLVTDSRRSESYKYSLSYQLLDLLAEHFMDCGYAKAAVRDEGAAKLQEVMRYIDQNFCEKVSLSEIAEKMYLSTSTLSRLFKKQTGIHFAEYVNQVRLKHAVSELLYTGSNITRIAMNSGFSNVSAFNRVFRDYYGIAPTEYRNQNKERMERKFRSKEKLKNKLQQELQALEKAKDADGPKESVCIEADAAAASHYEKNWNKAINIGSVYNLTLANLQYHVLALTEELGFSYIRVWNVFSKKLMICDGESIGYYNYDKMDTAFDFIVSHHIRVFLDLGKRPDTAVKTPGVSVFYEEEYIEFQSREAWEAMVKDFVHHVVTRYGKEVVETWIFELSYDMVHGEKNYGCYRDESFDYFQAYQFVYQTVKCELPKIQVGGPSALTEYMPDSMENFLKKCVRCQCIPDFISFMLFPYEIIKRDEFYTYRRNLEDSFELDMIRKYKRMLKEQGMEQCRIYISEWNNSISNRNYLNDSSFRGAYFAKKICEIWDSVDMICCWMGSDWMSSYYDSRSFINGASGILTKDGIKKPAWYALDFLNRLGDSVIERGADHVITKRGDTSYAILCFNFKGFSCNYFFLEEHEVAPSAIEDLFENADPVRIRITIRNLPVGGEYIVKKHRVNRRHGNILEEWRKFDYDSGLARADIKYIQDVNVPGMERKRVTAEHNMLRLETELEEHEIMLIHIYKQKD
nr:helix-turn-helix domain-containing protein [uncultured Schaedlerella sp.]